MHIKKGFFRTTYNVYMIFIRALNVSYLHKNMFNERKHMCLKYFENRVYFLG